MFGRYLVFSVLVACLSMSGALAAGPFSVSAHPGAPGEWVYTLYNNGDPANYPVIWLLEIAWDSEFDDLPVQPAYHMVSSPDANYWTPIDGNPCPGWESSDPLERPGIGSSLGGFVVASTQPATYFRATYFDNYGLTEQTGGVTSELVPEPGSLAAIMGGLVGLAIGARRRIA